MADHLRLSDLEPLFIAEACADFRPDFDWDMESKAGRARKHNEWKSKTAAAVRAPSMGVFLGLGLCSL